MRVYWEIEQRTPAWRKIRSGVPSASQFHRVVTAVKGDLSKSRFGYACELIAARLLNWERRSLDTEDVVNGREREPSAIRHMEFMHDLETLPVGWVSTDDGRLGASPDRFVKKTLVPCELKCPSDPVMLRYLLFGQDEDYRPQISGQMFICEADEAIFCAWNPRTPEYFVRTHRDESYIQKLAQHLNQFTDELDMLTDKAKALGLYQAYEDAAEEDVPRLVETDPGMAEAIAKAGGDQ